MIVKFIKEFTESALNRVRSLKSNDSYDPKFTLVNEEEEKEENVSLQRIEKIEEEIKVNYNEVKDD